MSNVAHPQAPSPRAAERRSVAVPGASKQKDKGDIRGGLLLLGLLLVVISGGAFWYILRGLDEREEYLVAARTLERWDIAGPGDFTVIEANLGDAVGVPPQFAGVLLGQWAVGRIPAGSIVTPGMFAPAPLSGENEAGMILMEVNLPVDEAPGGTLESGDRIALFGVESTAGSFEEPFAEPEAGLIGILALDVVEGDTLTYLVTPADARIISDVVDRFNAASERRIWKLGTDLSREQLVDLYGASGTPPALGDPFAGVLPAPDGGGSP